MNYKLVLSVLGKTLILEGVLLLFPMLCGIIYGEDTLLSFIIPILCVLAIGVPLSLIKVKNKTVYAKEGFIIVATAWIVLSLFGALPFVISKEIPNYIDALFETVSGFSTTGASILSDMDILSKGIMFWRVFTHFLGGMGVLVFVIAILPSDNSGAMYIFKAESPGPSASKIVGKIKNTARILYLLYVLLTLIEFVILLFSGIGVYDSLLTAFSTAGTGGYAVRNGSIAYYNSSFVEITVAVFMFLFGINFNLFYLIFTGNILKAIKSEEFLLYVGILFVATVTIAVNILSSVESFGVALRQSFFQVASFSSTTGFSTAEFETWPTFSKSVLMFLTIMGACGGSTGGGIKVARLAILFKSGSAEIRRAVSPREIISVKFEGKPLYQDVEQGVRSYFILWVILVAICTMVLSLDGNDLWTNFSATLACIGNVGPGLTTAIGSVGSYAFYSWYSKVTLSVIMLAGRLEIFPLLILLAPRTWKK